ncbi:hypothetical protein ACIPSA_05820 [Streptomyces sp. NPDC086549]|uniref:hypothetical protein n=1 Tax=Streptomyces sp. NPDC086549 TaxID=3365752 RepID=UPI0037FE0A14
MNMQWRSVSRRRGMVMAGAVAALLAAGGAASAATSGHATTAKHDGVTLTPASGTHSHPHKVPQSLEEVPCVELPSVDKLPKGEGKVLHYPIKITGKKGKTTLPPATDCPVLEEVPGATPQNVKDMPAGKAKELHVPIKVIGGTGKTELRPTR